MRAARHGPNRLGRYQETHDTLLRQFFRDEFACSEDLQWEALSGELRLHGEIGCRGDIIICVEKTLEVIEGEGANAIVQTIEYSYNASIRGRGTFLRYDNAHAHSKHETPHHRHEFDWDTGEELPGSPACTGDDWPHLNEFLDEVRGWYWKNKDSLPNPDACPVLSLRK